MIPNNLQWAFEAGHRVQTPGGIGRTERRRLANLVLSSGNISLGYPGDNIVNIASSVRSSIPPGSYPVFVTLAKHKGGLKTVAFVTVSFVDTEIVSWEKVASFFTDSGDGCICDASVIGPLRQQRQEMSSQQWQKLKTGTLEDGDGNLVLDEEVGTNAIVFRACDWSYDCFIGRDSANNVACLTIDGRVHDLRKKGIRALLESILPRRKAQ